MKYYIHLYFAYARCHLRGLARHRADLFLGIFSSLIVNGISLIFVTSIFQWVPDIRGWTLPQMLFMVGFAQVARSVHLVFFDNFWSLGTDYVRQGRLDVLMVRPVSPLFQLIAERLNPDGLGFLLIGGTLISKASLMLGLIPSIGTTVVFVLALVGGGLIYAGLNLAAMAFSLWIGDATGLAQATHTLSDYARFPLSIFGQGFELLLSSIIPYGFVAYYPCLVFLGKAHPLSLTALPFVTAIVWTLALTIWSRGLRHYGSSGS